MKLGVKQYLVGVVLLFVSTFFLPQGVSDFAHAASTGTPVPDLAPLFLVLGLLIVLAGLGCLARGYWLTRRPGVPRGVSSEDDPDEPLFRPGYGPATPDRDAWAEHPLRRRDGDRP